MKCPVCGCEVSEHEKFCTNCGSEIKVEALTDQSQSKSNLKPAVIIGTIAMILCFVIVAVVVLMKSGSNSSEDKKQIARNESAYESVTEKSETEEAVTTEAEEKEEAEPEEKQEEVGEPEQEAETEPEKEAAEPEEKEEKKEKVTKTEKKEVEEIDDTSSEEQASDTKPLTAQVQQVAEPIYNSAVSDVYSTSYLAEPQYGLVHDGWKLLDGDTSTAWAEDADGNGVGECVTLVFDKEYIVTGFYIYNGHQKTADLFKKNSRPKEITIYCSDGSSCEVSLEDSMGKQMITFGSPIQISSITFEIGSVYAGSKYEDTCISEISLF